MLNFLKKQFCVFVKKLKKTYNGFIQTYNLFTNFVKWTIPKILGKNGAKIALFHTDTD